MKLREDGIIDINNGEYYPYLQPRTINQVSHVDFLFEEKVTNQDYRHFMEDLTHAILQKKGMSAETMLKAMQKKVSKRQSGHAVHSKKLVKKLREQKVK